MERYETQNNYEIVNISRSADCLSLRDGKESEGVKFLFLPFLVLDNDEKIATAILTSRFIDENDKPISNELTVQMVFKFSGDLPIVREGEEKVKIQNYADLLSIFDTTIGAFRGILHEWLKGSSLQQPLPFVDIEEFVKDLRISFSK